MKLKLERKEVQHGMAYLCVENRYPLDYESCEEGTIKVVIDRDYNGKVIGYELFLDTFKPTRKKKEKK